jgi:hypothetical protein
MARKFKLNEDKFKVAFIFANEGCNPKKDRSIIESEKIIMYVVGCADYSQAETVAQEMLEEGCAAIYVVLSEMRVLPESARLLIDRFLSVQSTLTFILLSETKAAMISSKRIFGVLGFRTNRRTDETREIIFLYL